MTVRNTGGAEQGCYLTISSYWSPESAFGAGNQDPQTVLWRTRTEWENSVYETIHDLLPEPLLVYMPQRSTQASITSGKRFRYENTSRLRWLPPVQTLPGLPEGGGVAVGAEPG
ncbi:UPF0325 protein [Dissostichus eleginoides]|uniref:UPF0325 protein n=1 Tax=Dissostichus eleginoides TaxID=100907 RepID=A0AAD9FL08_DISEL|nr:UPF0325 protein [Dissostichus eleginoides]